MKDLPRQGKMTSQSRKEWASDCVCDLICREDRKVPTVGRELEDQREPAQTAYFVNGSVSNEMAWINTIQRTLLLSVVLQASEWAPEWLRRELELGWSLLVFLAPNVKVTWSGFVGWLLERTGEFERAHKRGVGRAAARQDSLGEWQMNTTWDIAWNPKVAVLN